jgi:hypothetical protein
LFEQTYGDHSWGIVAEFRAGGSGGSDRPSILFSNGYNSTTWSVGFGGYDDQFRINQNHGHRNGDWGTERFRIDTGGTAYLNGNTMLHAGNYSSYAVPQSSVSESGGGSVILKTASNGYLYINSWINTGGGGLFSSTNGAHFYPNDADYGAWRINGSRNGWNGIYFDTGSTLMMNSDTVGFHRSGYGWQMRWAAGTGYVHKGNPGGGTEATILDSSNYTSYVQLPYAGWDSYPGKDANTVSGGAWMRSFFTYANNAPFNGALVHFPAGGYDLQFNGAYSDGTGRLSFRNRNGDNGTFIGWRQIIHSGNYSEYALPLSGGTISGNQTITGNLTVSSGNVTGNGIILADDGDIVDLNDGYCAMRFSYGVRIHSANRGGSAVHTLHSNGTFTSSGDITAYSDERLKTDWAPVAGDFVEQLAKVKSGTYTRIDNNKRQAGSSAQDWQQLLPEVVTEADDEEKTLSMAYGNAALVSTVELAKRVVDQEKRIAHLESLINKLTGD